MWNQTTQARSCQELLSEFRQKPPPGPSTKIILVAADAHDAYNAYAPFRDQGDTLITGRVEPRAEEISEVVFFCERSGQWIPRPDTRHFVMQDPFVTRIHQQLVVGGVKIQTNAADPATIVGWHTALYHGPSLASLKPLAVGPPGRIQLSDGRIGLFTRPMRRDNRGADIGFRVLDRLKDLSFETMLDARVLRGQFIEGEWGGVGEAHALQNGAIGTVGHIACRSADGHLHYYAYTFAINPLTGDTTAPQIIAERQNFPPGPAKRWNLVDVVLSGGLRHRCRGRAELYVGISDTESYHINIADPFLDYETLPLRS